MMDLLVLREIYYFKIATIHEVNTIVYHCYLNKTNYLGYSMSVRGGVTMIQSVVNNVIKEDDRFRIFKSDILFQDCNNSYSKCKSLNSRDS